MIAALSLSGVFVLASFVYHRVVGPNYFYGLGPIRLVYFFVIASRAITVIILIPFIVRALHLAWKRRSMEYARLARWTLPLWLYASLANVAVYGMIHRMPTPDLYEFESRLETAAMLPGAPSWAGTYRDDGGNHGSDDILTLGTEGYCRRGSMMYEVWGKADPSMDFGTVAPAGDGVLLLRSGGWGPARKLRLIPWDDRVYAIFDDEKLEFLNNANELLEPKERAFVWQMPYKAPNGSRGRRTSASPVPSGLPVVPEDWNALLLRRPVEASVIKVGAIRYIDDVYPRRISVELDSGRSSGLAPGMLLQSKNFPHGSKIVLTSVGEHSSSGDAFQSDSSQPFESQRLPWIGQRAVSYSVFGDIWEKR